MDGGETFTSMKQPHSFLTDLLPSPSCTVDADERPSRDRRSSCKPVMPKSPANNAGVVCHDEMLVLPWNDQEGQSFPRR